MRQVHSNTHCCLWSGHIRKQGTTSAVIHKPESRHKVPKSVLRAVLRRMQFTLHATCRTPHGASRLVQAMSAWSVKTPRAPSRHSRDGTVYGHTTTAMHKLSTPPPPPWRFCSKCAYEEMCPKTGAKMTNLLRFGMCKKRFTV